MTDIIERLRSYRGPWLVPAEAADEIERLRGEYAASRGYAEELRAERDAARAERDAAVAALKELLADMALDYAGPGYDVYQVRMGAVAEAVAAIDATKGEK